MIFVWGFVLCSKTPLYSFYSVVKKEAEITFIKIETLNLINNLTNPAFALRAYTHSY